MKNILTTLSLLLLLLLQACSDDHWKKIESKDAFTDKITKYYNSESIDSTGSIFSIGCSKNGYLNFYVEYPSREGIPSTTMSVNIRIDDEKPFEEQWYVSWVSGVTIIENPYNFFQKIKGKSKLAIEIIAATKNTFNIKGINSIVSDMEQTACQFENKIIVKELSSSDMPKFAAKCEASNLPSFVLVTEPAMQRLYFSRQDHQYDPQISTKVKLTDKNINAVTFAPCCKDSSEVLDFNRQTGELKRSFSNGGVVVMQCEKMDESQYDSELSASIEHYKNKLTEAENKEAAEKSKIEQQRNELIKKENSTVKF